MPDPRPAAEIQTPAELFDLTGRRILVTGASSGLGAVLARGAAAAGGDVTVVARRLDRLEELAAGDSRIRPLACDLTIDADRVSLVDTVLDRGVDVLINNAGGMGAPARAEDEVSEAIASTLLLNLLVPLELSRSVAMHMRDSGGGSIINIASISGLVGCGRIPQASYAASKGGLIALTRELALQWARHDIRVNAIAAGYFESELTESLYDSPRLSSWVSERTPLQRRGRPADFVGTMLLLASAAGEYITGQTFVVDGGWTAQ